MYSAIRAASGSDRLVPSAVHAASHTFTIARGNDSRPDLKSDLPLAFRLPWPRRENRMVMLFAVTVFTSAALLFIVEPMIAKMMLPLLGGGPAVWNTCMVFYQIVLLGAYDYTHLLSRTFTKRRQVIIHMTLVGVSIAALPVILPSGMTPPADRSPIPWVLVVLARTAAV